MIHYMLDSIRLWVITQEKYRIDMMKGASTVFSGISKQQICLNIPHGVAGTQYSFGGLHLKMMSSSAYDSLRGILTLPCGQTLQDYTRFIKAGVGI